MGQGSSKKLTPGAQDSKPEETTEKKNAQQETQKTEQDIPNLPDLQRQKSTIHQEPVPESDWGEEESCGLCLMEFETGEAVIKLTKCKGHFFHKDCELDKTIGQYIEESKKCPVCAIFYGKKIGNQPNGQMKVRTERSSLPGYSGSGTIVINFSFPGGTQGANHYQPGKPYSSDSRTAYLPDCKEGKEVLRLFKQGILHIGGYIDSFM
jgi:deltex-like protein